MPKTRIKQTIDEIFKDEEYKFQIYIIMKDNISLKKIVLSEGKPNTDKNNFKKAIQNSIKETIISKFTSENSEYDLVENIADNQKKFYVLKQDESYNPFSIVNKPIEEIKKFSTDDIDNSKGILFKFKRQDLCIWAYQHIYPVTIPNKKRGIKYALQDGDIFIEMKKNIFPISQKVDMLIINDEIVTNDISLLEKQFKFEEFIKDNANISIEKIKKLGVVSNIEKVTDYVKRPRISYAKKMMRIRNSKVFEMSSDELLDCINTLQRWKGKFNIDDGKIVLKNFAQVKNLIELLDETYTRSDVTGQEYETSAKRLADPIEINEDMQNK